LFFKRYFNLIVLIWIKFWSRFFFWVENNWIHEHTEDPWSGVRLIVFLNHTSLYEGLFLGAVPWRLLYSAAGRIVIPAADVTMNRPIIGPILKLFSPKLVPISRKRDDTWDKFMNEIDDDSLVIILPEGQMKRATGLDKNDRPMTVRGGIADILEIVNKGKMVILYSGGLHHVQKPGQWIPKIFREIKMNSEKLDIAQYIEEMRSKGDQDFKTTVVIDLERRMDKFCPEEHTAEK